jgi:hypothetical protein
MDLDLFGENISKKPKMTRDELYDTFRKRMKDISLEMLVSLLTTEFEEIVEYYNLTAGNRAGQRISLLFNPHRLNTKTMTSERSIYQAFKTDNFLNGLARAVLFKQGAGNLKRLLYDTIQLGINGVQYVNEFPPHVARDVYDKYGALKDSKILDPCAGWGGRMLGASVVSDVYDCFEPATDTFIGLHKLKLFIQSMNPSFNPTISNSPFEDAIVKEDYYDVALTSPPYYDTEEYSNEDTNSLNRYKSFPDWRDNFYIPFIKKTMGALKDGRVFVLNIGSRKYPLNEVLLDTFGTTYQISKGDSMLSNSSGLGKSGEGETFYVIRKS